MKFATLAALGLVNVNAFLSDRITENEMAYMKYVTEWNKSYGTKAEFAFRLAEFEKNMAKIAEHNAKNGGSKVGLNQFADWTEAEYKNLLGFKWNGVANEAAPLEVQVEDDESLDWRTKGAVTPVKNQGACGSCWAFSTTGSVEGKMFLTTGNLQAFSEQQLVDCSKQNNGCGGGLMDYAFTYIESNPLMLESDYPYTAREGTCKYDEAKGLGKVKGFKDVPQDGHAAPQGAQLRAALKTGPVSVAVEADQSVFQFYTSGVITEGCGEQLDHGVLAVGFGNDAGQDYFIVKNSWGPNWGDQGYLKIAPGQCGITMAASYPTE